ncbi:hypothetical protein ACL9RF_09330 [Sphingobacterium sp. Mn56C]|uniref:hypothetical protein n=1 Tax=Sphingobacterium sp. Mn56C TaxID=3395261 RepID=UPI003BCE49BE
MSTATNSWNPDVLFSKHFEIERLINETITSTYAWEKAGEPQEGKETIHAAIIIKSNFTRIIDIYFDLVAIHNCRNIKMKNAILPPPYPSEIDMQMAIMGILDFAEAIEDVNPSFKGQLIEPKALERLFDGRQYPYAE